jgi:drug/metabolite transporter (DMT)-like permease
VVSEIRPLPPDALVALAVLVATGIGAQWLLHEGLREVTASAAAIAGGLSAVTVATLDAALLGRRLSVAIVTGGIGFLLATIVVSRQRHRAILHATRVP